MPETIAKVTRYVANDNGLKVANQLVHGRRTLRVGVHAHDDRKRAVDNTFRAIEAGATHAQGTFNGGERLGNADLLAFLGTLRENYGIEVVPVDILARWKEQSERLLQLCGLPPDPRRP